MRYLITGATGFIGPYLIEELVSQGHSCRCLVRADSDTSKLKSPSIDLEEGDITKSETLIGIADNIDCVFHLATLGHMANYTVTEAMFEAINVQGTRNIMAEASRAGVGKFIHCSSVAAMGICSEIPATEKSHCIPHHPYGRSKLKAEQEVLKMVATRDFPATIIRFSMVYGPGDWRDILKLTRMAKKGLFPKIGSRPKLTPLIHVNDAVRGILLASEHGKLGQTYLITNSQSEPFDRLMKVICAALGRKCITIPVPEWLALNLASFLEKAFLFFGKTPPVSRKNIESTLADRVFSIEKATEELGFSPTINPESGLRDTVRWYRENDWI